MSISESETIGRQVIEELITRGYDPQPLRKNMYKLNNSHTIILRYSKAMPMGASNRYWFAIPGYFTRLNPTNTTVLFICGKADTIYFAPAPYLHNLLHGVPYSKTACGWYISIYGLLTRGEDFEISVTGKERESIQDQLLDWDSLNQTYDPPPELLVVPPSTPSPQAEETANDEEEEGQDELETSSPETESIETQVMALDNVNGNSFHDRLIDLLCQIGNWVKYSPKTSFKITQDSAYKLDVAWLIDEALHVAIEVQVGGNPTEAIDRIRHARQFGARKCVIVSTPDHIERLKSILRYDPLRNWVEIWQASTIYSMFLDGKEFFNKYNIFNRHQYREEIPIF